MTEANRPQKKITIQSEEDVGCVFGGQEILKKKD